MNQIRLYVWGDYACFTRPEMKMERVSYDVIRCHYAVSGARDFGGGILKVGDSMDK